MNAIADNLARVHERIRAAAAAAARSPDDIRLLAVSKSRGADAIEMAADTGQHEFGENYLQEAAGKIAALAGNNLTWHFIGPIQSNKTRDIATQFDWVHSVDRFKIARRLSEQRPGGLPPLNICLQVNISAEASKSGVAPDQLEELAKATSDLPQLRLRGLMAIPAPAETCAAQREPFARLRQHFSRLQQAGLALDTLSMGMSDDLEAAILEGSTLVRVGTAIFGPRA